MNSDSTTKYISNVIDNINENTDLRITKEFLDSITDDEIKLIKTFFERIYKRNTSGRKQVIETESILKEWNAGKTRREISDTLGVSYSSVCRIIKENNGG